MPVGVLQASVPRRAGAYLIDLLLAALPLALSLYWLLVFGFSPSAPLGWTGVGGLAVVGMLYALFTAVLNARTGQSLGKKLMGLRVLRADTHETAGLADSLLRGSAFFLGLLGAGILPLMMVKHIRNGEDSAAWPHRLVDTRLIDIRRGHDPLNPEPVYYPVFPEQWVAAGEEAGMATVLGSAPRWSSAYVPVAVKEMPPRPDAGPAEQAGKQHKSVLAAALFQSVAAMMVIAALCAGMAAGVAALQPTPGEPQDNRAFSASALAQQEVRLSSYPGVGFPGFTSGPVWKRAIGPNALAVSAAAGTFVFDNRTLTILDNASGQVRAKETLDGAVLLTQETRLGNEAGMAWQIGSTLHGWVPSLGTKPSVKATLPKGAKISAAGSSLLVQVSNGKAMTFTKAGLVPVMVPEDRAPLAVENGKLLSARFGGPLTISSLDGKQRNEVPLLPPADNLQVLQWVTAGHGVAVLLWSAFPDSKDPNNPVTIAVYRQGTGELLSQLEVTRSRINEDPAWVRGNGFVSASYAGYFYNLSNGWPILDLKAQAIRRSGMFGDGVTGERQEGTVFMRKDNSWIYSGLQPLGITRDGAVVRTKDNELQRFSAG